jgi:hypothetical protein
VTIIAQESSFTTGSGTSIAGEALNTGGVWTKHAALSDGDLVGDGSGGAYESGSGQQAFYYGSTASPGSADYISSIRFSQIGAAGTLGPVCRLNTSIASHVYAVYNGATNTYSVFWLNDNGTVSSGSWTTLTEWTSSAGIFTPVAGDWLHLKVEGGTYEVRAGNATFASATVLKASTSFTSGYPSAAGQPGVFAYDGSALRTKLDRWTAETLATVTATEVRFTSAPTSVGQEQTFSVTVQATDGSGAIDVAKTGTCALSTNLGTLGGTTSMAMTAGQAVFSGLTLDTQGSATVTASYTGLTSDTTGITVTENTTDRYRPTLRNALVAGVEAQFSGGHVYLYTSSTPGAGTQLVDVTIPVNCFTDPSTGTITLTGTWSGTATASGTPQSYRVYKSDGVTLLQQGDVGYTGSGADLIYDNGAGSASIAASDIVGISAWTFLAPAD